MTRQEALKFWEWRYENAKDYYDDHWEADERRSHREYVEALEWAVKALADRKTEPTMDEALVISFGSDVEKYHQAKRKVESESTISKTEQVEDEPKTQKKTQNSNLTFEKADEPQAERSE